MREAINPPGAPKPFRPVYSNAIIIEAKKLIFVAGQLSLDVNGNLVGKGDIGAQARQALDNVSAVLKGAGASLDDVAKLNIYVTSLSRYEDVAKVRAEYFKNNPPATTLVQVAALVTPDFLIEIDATAALT